MSDFDVQWECSFPLQRDLSSCGVYVLLYVSFKLGLLCVDPVKDDISQIRNTMVLELVRNKKTEPTSTAKSVIKRKCCVPSLYKCPQGGTITLRCKAFGGCPESFCWTLDETVISLKEVFTFKLNDEFEGVYTCKVTYDDGFTMMSSRCNVLAQVPRVVNVDEIASLIKTNWSKGKTN